MNSPIRFFFPLFIFLLFSVHTECALSDYQQYLDSAAVCAGENRFIEATSNYYKGLNAYKEYYNAQIDSLNRQLAIEFEIDRKEQELEEFNEILQLRKIRMILFSGLITILIVAMVLLLFIQKYRLRIINQKYLSKENESKSLKSEKEKKELEVRLHSFQVSNYQRELLAGTLLIDYKNQAIKDLKIFFNSHPEIKKYKSALEKIITEKDHNNTDAEGINTKIQDIYPTFYARLQKQANNKLTPIDLKYCRMIYLNMSTKEMSELLHVNANTVRITKYRLKRKLGLDKEADLKEFILQVGGG